MKCIFWGFLVTSISQEKNYVPGNFHVDDKHSTQEASKLPGTRTPIQLASLNTAAWANHQPDALEAI